MSVASFSAAC